MKNKHLIAGTILVLLTCTFSFAQKKYDYPFQNYQLTVGERVNDLVSRLTLEEKASQMIDNAAAIPRLGIPAYNWWNEALHGVARAGAATVFPQAIALGATWDTTLIFKIADVISTEARAKHHEALRNNDFGRYKGLTIWSPNVNIFRDPRWGRGQETYGEDPYLTSRIGLAFVKGLQGNDPKYLKTIATPKHYAVHSGPEPERHKFNAITDRRDFMETYSPAFETLIREGKAWSIMGAYNRYMDDPCCASPYLLQDLLRKQWGFQGFVVSDCDAIADIYRDHKTVKTAEEATAISLKAGCDLNCGNTYLNLKSAVDKGLLTEQQIDVNLKRLFEARFRLGMFDPTEVVKYAQIPADANDTRENRAVALEAARKSIVLLKNEHNILPLSKTIQSIAVIGPNADDADVMYGNYNGKPSAWVVPLQGIKNKVSPQTKVTYLKACNWVDGLNDFDAVQNNMLRFEGKTGIQGEYFSNANLEGEPTVKRIDKNVDFDWGAKAPKGITIKTGYSARWTGKLKVPTPGKYVLSLTGTDGYRLYIDGKRVIDSWQDQPKTTAKFETEFQANQECDVKIEYYQNNGNASIHFEYAPILTKDPLQEAVEEAAKSDVVIFLGGISPSLEGEEMKVNYDGFKGGDRVKIDLPAIQEKLLKALSATGKPVVLVLMNGSALAINWASDKLPAILETWYPGEEGGTAIADVLFGDYNPSGRLPITFYKSLEQLPTFEEYAMKGRTYRYFEGEALYSFGYGLSYTSFQYSHLTMPASVATGQNVTLSVEVTNTGNVSGDEVVQLYVSNKTAKVPVAIRSLQGFSRISLKPGEKKMVQFTLTPRQMSVVDKSMTRVEEANTLEVSVGGAQPVVAKQATSNFVTGKVTLTGNTIAL
jgi:beta-glucosidase